MFFRTIVPRVCSYLTFRWYDLCCNTQSYRLLSQRVYEYALIQLVLTRCAANHHSVTDMQSSRRQNENRSITNMHIPREFAQKRRTNDKCDEIRE